MDLTPGMPQRVSARRTRRAEKRALIDARRTRLGNRAYDFVGAKGLRQQRQTAYYRENGHSQSRPAAEYDRLNGWEAVFLDDREARREALAPTDGFLAFVAMGG